MPKQMKAEEPTCHRKPENERLTETFSVRFSVPELARIAEAARVDGRNVNNYIRRVVLASLQPEENR